MKVLNLTANQIPAKPVNVRAKKVYMYNDKGEFLESFTSAYKAAEQEGFSQTGIQKACKKGIGWYKNHLWAYESYFTQAN